MVGWLVGMVRGRLRPTHTSPAIDEPLADVRTKARLARLRMFIPLRQVPTRMGKDSAGENRTVHDPIAGCEVVATKFAAARSGVGSEIVERWLEHLQPAGTIVDVGCGTGVPVSRVLVAAGFPLMGSTHPPRFWRHSDEISRAQKRLARQPRSAASSTAVRRRGCPRAHVSASRRQSERGDRAGEPSAAPCRPLLVQRPAPSVPVEGHSDRATIIVAGRKSVQPNARQGRMPTRRRIC